MAIKRKNLTVEGHAVSAIIGVILMVAITVAIAAAVYYYVLPMMVSPGDTAPNIAWDTNTIDNKISITTGATGFTYASTSDGITTANLAFRTATNTYYLDSNLNLQLSRDLIQMIRLDGLPDPLIVAILLLDSLMAKRIVWFGSHWILPLDRLKCNLV